MERGTYIDTLTAMFARFGFSCNPLTAGEMEFLHDMGVSIGDAFAIGCDVNAEIAFHEAVECNADNFVEGRYITFPLSEGTEL